MLKNTNLKGYWWMCVKAGATLAIDECQSFSRFNTYFSGFMVYEYITN